MFNVGSVQGYLKLNTVGWNTPMRRAATSLTSLTRSFVKLGAVAVGSLFLIEREFGKFDKAIRHATSVSETTQEQFKKMSDMALDASVQWNKAATNTAQAFYFLGSAGLTVNEQLAAFNDTIMLSRAMGSELGQTVEGVVDIVRAFGLEFQNITSIADQLTKTVISSNQQFRTLSQALSYGASTARLANNTLAETTAMLGVMANAGIKGSMAGTVLRRAITNLMSPTGAMAGLIYELGVNIYDSTGKMNPFINIMGQISDQLKGTSDEYKNMVFEVLFGRRAIAGQIVLFNYGSEALQEYANSIRDAGGTTERVAGKQMKAFTEQLGRLWRELQRVAIVAGDTLAPAIERLADKMREHVKAFRYYIQLNKDAVREALKWTAAISALAIATPVVLAVVSAVISLINPFTVVISTLYLFRAVWLDTFKHGGVLNSALDDFGDVLNEWISNKFGAFGRMFMMVVQGWSMIMGQSFKGWELIINEIDKHIGIIMGVDPFAAKTPGPKFSVVAAAGKKAAAELGKMAVSQMKKDMGTAAKVIESVLPKGMKEALNSIRELFSAFMTEPAVDNLSILNKKQLEQKNYMDLMNDAFAVSIKRRGYLAGEWNKALKMVFAPPAGESKTWVSTLTSTLKSVESAWADTFSNMSTRTGKFRDFMDEMFIGVINSLNRMVAEIAAADLLHAITGGAVERTPGTPTIVGLVKGLFGFDRKRESVVQSGVVPSVSNPSYKMIPVVTINVDTRGEPVKLHETSRRMDGKQLIINTVMEAYEADPSIREALNR